MSWLPVLRTPAVRSGEMTGAILIAMSVIDGVFPAVALEAVVAVIVGAAAATAVGAYSGVADGR